MVPYLLSTKPRTKEEVGVEEVVGFKLEVLDINNE